MFVVVMVFVFCMFVLVHMAVIVTTGAGFTMFVVVMVFVFCMFVLVLVFATTGAGFTMLVMVVLIFMLAHRIASLLYLTS